VALDGAAAVRRLVVATQMPELQFPLGSDPFFGQYYAEDIAVQPGSPGVVAVSLKYTTVSPRHAGVGIYEDGVARPTMTPGHTGSNIIEFADVPSRLYGANTETTEFGFRRMIVDSSGVVVEDVTANLLSGFSSDMEFAGGLIYGSSGQAIDPEARTTVGTYPVPFLGTTLVEPDVALGLVYFLTGNTLYTFDQVTFLQQGAPFTVPGVQGEPRGWPSVRAQTRSSS
jgi:hypothetical protein